MSAVLSTTRLAIGYRNGRSAPVVVASGIDLSLEAGEFVCLLGPNGAGKSTLLRTLAGQQPPLAGTVRLQGNDLSTMPKPLVARFVSLVLTERVTTSLLTVYDLVGMGRLPYTGWSGALTPHDHSVIAEALTFVAAEDLAAKRLSELSDGERQRCLLARALAQKPALLILDEITAFLDLPRRMEMMHKLQQLAHERGVAVLLSTHDLDLALAGADRILLKAKDGPVQDGGPEDLVLSGAFEHAFASEEMLFDRASGSFSRPRKQSGAVCVQVAGVDGYWVRRAFERRAFACLTEAGPDVARIERHADGRWIRIDRDDHTHFTSIAALLRSFP